MGTNKQLNNNKERLSYSANGPWTAEMNNFCLISSYQNQNLKIHRPIIESA